MTQAILATGNIIKQDVYLWLGWECSGGLLMPEALWVTETNIFKNILEVQILQLFRNCLEMPMEMIIYYYSS